MHLCLRRGFQAVFIERLPGERVHSLAVKLGGVLPLHVGAAPRALLAFEPSSFWDEYFAAVPIEPWTDRVAGRRRQTSASCCSTSGETGVAISDEDVVAGVATVGAPIFDHRGAVRAALAFNLLPGRVPPRPRLRTSIWLAAASVEASRAFGYDLAANGLPCPMTTEERRMDLPADNCSASTIGSPSSPAGASGLGAAFSRGLAAAGATVVVADINEALADEVVGEIAADGGSAEFRSVDVTDVPPSNAFADDVVEAHGRVDVLVNSAGAAHRSPIDEFSEEAYDRILALNLKGTYFMSQAIGRKMLAQGKGSIINIASIGGFIAYPHSSAYLCSKGGVVQATRSFALEWNGRVRVNAIAPGLCETPLLKKVLADERLDDDDRLHPAPDARRR